MCAPREHSCSPRELFNSMKKPFFSMIYEIFSMIYYFNFNNKCLNKFFLVSLQSYAGRRKASYRHKE